MSTEEKVARWIFKASFLDAEEETWNSMMLDELIQEVRRIIKKP